MPTEKANTNSNPSLKSSFSKYLSDEPITVTDPYYKSGEVKPAETPISTNQSNSNNDTDDVSKQKKFLIGFGSAIFVITTASCYHLVDFFKIANSDWMSWALAISFEVVVIGILLGVGVLKDVKKGYINTIFWVIFILQAIGNVYSSYLHFTTDPAVLIVIDEFFKFKFLQMNKFWISVLLGFPLPLISFFLMKSISSYFEESYLNRFSKRRR